MFSQILCQLSSFEKEHGKKANVIYLNPDHFAVLRLQCPSVFADLGKSIAGIPSNIRVAILQTELLPHPRVAWVQPGMRMIFGGSPHVLPKECMGDQDMQIAF